MLFGWCIPFPRSESSVGRRTVSQDDGNSSWPDILAGHWVAPTVSHVLGDGGTQVSPGGQWLRAGASDGTESMKLSLEKIHAEDSVLSFRTPRGCHRKRDRAPCCGPREEGGTHGRHRFCCSVARSRRPKLYLVGICPLFSSQFSPGVLSSGRTPVSHGSFLKTLCPQSHTWKHCQFSRSRGVAQNSPGLSSSPPFS